MHNFEEKIKTLSEIREELDSYIWTIFDQYLKASKRNFSNPEYWEEQEDSIYFSGYDGCMGCYNNMGMSIPLMYFTDPINSFAKLKCQIEEVEKSRIEKQLAKDKKE